MYIIYFILIFTIDRLCSAKFHPKNNTLFDFLQVYNCRSKYFILTAYFMKQIKRVNWKQHQQKYTDFDIQQS